MNPLGSVAQDVESNPTHMGGLDHVIIGMCVAWTFDRSSVERTSGSSGLLAREIESNPTRLRLGTGPDCMWNDCSRVVVPHLERICTESFGRGRYVIIGVCVA